MALLSTREIADEAEVCRCHSPSVLGSEIEHPQAARHAEFAKRLRGAQLAREAVLLSFCDPVPEQCSRLQNLSSREWRNLLRWLDVSGLALYFFDRMIKLQLSDWLPAFVLKRLWRNLIDNTERTQGMIGESAAIQQKFQQAGLCYAVLKGVSFWPIAVPRPELRSQFDLDFLVAEESLPDARNILERRGYRLYAVSGRSWEFKLNERPGLSLKDLYKEMPSHAVELHVESRTQGRASILERVEWRELYNMRMPTLSPFDLFLGQGLHLYKHLCSEFSRAAHLLEFRRHVLARRDDDGFWDELRAIAGENPRASLGLGTVVSLISRVMGEFAPEALTSWTASRLPQAARLWVEMYGRRVVFDDFPGSKLYLLLQRELESSGVPARRSMRKALLPSCLPPPVIKAFPNETWRVRVSRYRMQLQLILLRLRFHVVEGLRFVWESYRWRKQREWFVR